MEEKLDAKTLAGLLGLLAHDLRNPLSALHSNVGFLAAAPQVANDDMREAVADALVSCDGLVAIIDNIELLAQAITGDSPRSVGPVGVRPVVTELVAAYRSMAESHEVNLVLEDSAAESSLQVMVHREMYRRALSNVLRNAIQHGAGSRVSVTTRVVGDCAQVLIIDQGPRLDTELGDEPFTAVGQLSAKTKPGGRYGRGLGLFCARFAAENAGAELLVAEPPADAGNAFAVSARQP